MKISFKPYYFFFCLLIVFSSCKKEEPKKTNPEVFIAAKDILNLSYGSDNLQKMDVYLPTNRTANTKLIVFIHGGSFIEGDKSDFTVLVKELVRENFAIVNLRNKIIK